MDIQHTPSPETGKGYPRNWSEFLDWFSSEESCLAYREQLRWPTGFVCPTCGVAGEPYRSSRSRLMCRSCSHQSTVTAGTIFDKTRTPLRVWLAGAWYLTNQKHGVSALTTTFTCAGKIGVRIRWLPRYAADYPVHCSDLCG